MTIRKLGTLFLVEFLILTTVVAALDGQGTLIVYVAGDGSRDF